jgi:hypothetical protein
MLYMYMCWHDFFRAELGAFLLLFHLAHNTKSQTTTTSHRPPWCRFALLVDSTSLFFQLIFCRAYQRLVVGVWLRPACFLSTGLLLFSSFFVGIQGWLLHFLSMVVRCASHAAQQVHPPFASSVSAVPRLFRLCPLRAEGFLLFGLCGCCGNHCC